MAKSARARAYAVACAAVTASLRFASAVDLPDVQPAAMDQPQINEIVFIGNNTLPQFGETFVIDPNDILNSKLDNTFNITAYLDTGASGILISQSTATLLGIPKQTLNGVSVLYYDVGVAGSDQFEVSQPIRISLANYFPRTDTDTFSDAAHTLPVIAPYTPIPNLPGDNLRAQVGPVDLSVANPVTDEFSQLLADLNALDVVGMPAMKGRVMVMDPSRVNIAGSLFDGKLDITQLDDLPDFSMRTYLYAPHTPFHAATADTDPGIPATQLHVKLSFASFDKFTQVTPGGTGPTLAHNPFIGKDPVALLAGQSTPDVPGIKITFNSSQGSKSSEGNWLLDTGAAASIISTAEALAVGVKYLPGTEPGNVNDLAPVLVDALTNVPLTKQFSLMIGGIGGTTNVAGFYLDSLLVRTIEGTTMNRPDLNLNFTDAPVLVSNITVRDPVSDQLLTLDGIFGMNFLVASASITGTDLIPTVDLFSTGYFNWVTFDETAGELGLSFDPASGISVSVPEPASLALMSGALLLLTTRRRSGNRN